VLLLPRHRVYLEVSAGDGPRFAKLFRTTWKRLPLWSRRLLLKYWTWGVPCFGVLFRPRIELTDSPILNQQVVGATLLRGNEIKFRARHVDRMPDAVVQVLIAHELVHVVLIADGIDSAQGYPSSGRVIFKARRDNEGRSRFEIEQEVDDFVAELGFDPDSVQKWALSTGLTKVEKVTELSKEWLVKYFRRLDRYGR
jgi:hypothetical protein